MGFPLLLNKALKWGQESWIRGLYKLDFVEEGHVQSGHVGFPLPLNKALKWGQKAWILGLSQLDFMEEGHVQSGQVEGSFVVLMWALLLCFHLSSAPSQTALGSRTLHLGATNFPVLGQQGP